MANNTQNSPFIKSLASSGTKPSGYWDGCVIADAKDRQGNPRPGPRFPPHIPQHSFTHVRAGSSEAVERSILLYGLISRSSNHLAFIPNSTKTSQSGRISILTLNRSLDARQANKSTTAFPRPSVPPLHSQTTSRVALSLRILGNHSSRVGIHRSPALRQIPLPHSAIRRGFLPLSLDR